jgi:hypothetical protein
MSDSSAPPPHCPAYGATWTFGFIAKYGFIECGRAKTGCAKHRPRRILVANARYTDPNFP